LGTARKKSSYSEKKEKPREGVGRTVLAGLRKKDLRKDKGLEAQSMSPSWGYEEGSPRGENKELSGFAGELLKEPETYKARKRFPSIAG